MTGNDEIVVAPDGDAWSVSIFPAIDVGDEPVVVLDRDIAMARARLMWMRHGFPIIAPPKATRRAAR